MTNDNYPQAWGVSSLKELTERFINGGTPDTNNEAYWGGDIPWITGADTEERVTKTARKYITRKGVRNSATNVIPKGNILFVSRTGVGKVSVAGIDVAISQDLTGIIPNHNKVDVEFLYYQLRRLSSGFAQLSQGTIIQGMQREEIEAIEVPYPELPEQRQIAAILSTIDATIEQTEAIIAKQRRIRQGLVQDLLTRGVDENGELRPTYEETPSLYKETTLGWLPKEWDVEQIKNVSLPITSGSRGWAKYYSEEGALFLRIGNLTREHINLRFDDIQRVNPPKGSEGSRTAVRQDDILISITADLGIIGVITFEFEEAYVNQHIALVRLQAGKTNARWVGHYLSSNLGQKQFAQFNESGAKAGLNLPTVSSIRFPNPLEKERNEIVRILDLQDQVIAFEKQRLVKYQHLKWGLMQDLLTGQVRVNQTVS